MNIKEIIIRNQGFLKGEVKTYFSPGRVNLIGEHIDYLGGSVFPTAISLGTYGFVSKREDQKVVFLSENFKQFGEVVVDLRDLEYKKEDNWTNYGKGMIKTFIEMGKKIPYGLNILVYGTLPNSSGLSSSASLELLIGEIFNQEFDLGIEMFDMVQIAQDVENIYVGVNCGIMDQFAIGMSKKEQAILLDTNTLKYEYVPLSLNDYTLVIANTNKKRALTESKYNERRRECDLGLEQLQNSGLKINALCEMDSSLFHDVKSNIKDDVVLKRVQHAVYENERTQNAVKALKENDLITFGRLMNESHDSLRDLFEVSCLELDTLVEAFRQNGATGARMTGAGFGGCSIILIEKDKAQQAIANVSDIYYKKIGYHADFYQVETSDGTKLLEVE
jgi:galactokinase